eukprot:gene1224-15593_t
MVLTLNLFQVLANEVEDYDEDSKDLRNADDIEDEMDEESMSEEGMPEDEHRSRNAADINAIDAAGASV